jgi:serine/threonine-protein kinase HipA
MARRPIHAPLNVYMNARLVGQLRRESTGAIDFQYNKDWLAWVSAIPVSVSLPLREDRYIGARYWQSLKISCPTMTTSADA